MTATDDRLEGIELAQQRARAELILAPARVARRRYLQALAARYRVDLGRLEVDDELAIQRAAHALTAAGAPVRWECVTVPTADQYLAGHKINHPPTVRIP